MRRRPRRRWGGVRGGSLRPRTASGSRPDPRRGCRGRAARIRRRHRTRGRPGPEDPGAHTGDRDAARRPVEGDRRIGSAIPPPRRRGLRHRGRRGRLSAEQASRCVRVHAGEQRALHHSCGRSIRTTVDPRGDQLLRCRPPRTWGPGDRGHRSAARHRSCGRCIPRRPTGRCGELRARQADSA